MNAQNTSELPSSRSGAGEEEPESEPQERLRFDVVDDGGDWSSIADPRRVVAEAARVIATHGAVGRWLPAVAAVALSSDATVQRFNRNYRGMDTPTNVLSFPSAREGPRRPGPRMLGDIVLADGVVAREAAELGIPLTHHFQHLVVHGALHLMGYDHETDDEAAVMERLETALLARLGIADPHAPID